MKQRLRTRGPDGDIVNDKDWGGGDVGPMQGMRRPGNVRGVPVAYADMTPDRKKLEKASLYRTTQWVFNGKRHDA